LFVAILQMTAYLSKSQLCKPISVIFLRRFVPHDPFVAFAVQQDLEADSAARFATMGWLPDLCLFPPGWSIFLAIFVLLVFFRGGFFLVGSFYLGWGISETAR